MVRLWFILALMTLPFHPAWCAAVTPEQAVALAAQAMADAGVTDASPVAPSRALPPCMGDVTARPRGGAWSTVEIACDSPRWTRALRTRASAAPITDDAEDTADAAPQRTAVGLTRALGKGDVIGADDLAMVALADRAPDQVYEDPSALVGRRMRQSLAAGRPIQPRHLQPDWIVQADAPVLILSQSGPISVRMAGRAEKDAALGDLVPVINTSSGRSLVARVIAKDTVAVTLKPFGKEP